MKEPRDSYLEDMNSHREGSAQITHNQTSRSTHRLKCGFGKSTPTPFAYWIVNMNLHEWGGVKFTFPPESRNFVTAFQCVGGMNHPTCTEAS